MWGSYGIHTIMIRDKDYSLQTCQQFIFVNQASCYMKKDTYEHTGETTCAVNVEEKTFLWSVSYIWNFLTPGLFQHYISNYIGFVWRNLQAIWFYYTSIFIFEYDNLGFGWLYVSKFLANELPVHLSATNVLNKQNTWILQQQEVRFKAVNLIHIHTEGGRKRF